MIEPTCLTPAALPLVRRSAVTRRAPYVPPDASKIPSIRVASVARRRAVADAGRVTHW